MHDPSVVDKLQNDFSQKTMDDCISFINHSKDEENIHLAITDDNDTHKGTVSLKHIAKETADFAITVHTEAMGRGYSHWTMKEILNIGFCDYKVKYILVRGKR